MFPIQRKSSKTPSGRPSSSRRSVLKQRLRTGGRRRSSRPVKAGIEPKKRYTRLDVCYELVKMIAGTGMSIAGTGGGAGMLRARRRDISIKPNRKLDRKSSRGMIYENEELRLRTIHINAEVEQGQNDIKKLRRENEQLRREIWSLRDEYDKLEEILKKQRSREESDEPEERSDDGASGSEYTENDDEPEEDAEEDESVSDESVSEADEGHERLENAENQKISSEKMNSSGNATNNSPTHRTIRNFNDLAVVDEEEELKKETEKKEEATSREQSASATQQLQSTAALQSTRFPFHPATSYDQSSARPTTSFGYQTDCPFGVASASESSGYANNLPINGNCLLMTTCPQLYAANGQQHHPINPSHDVSTSKRHTPPPAGWQSHVSIPIVPLNFPVVVAGTQSPLKAPEDTRGVTAVEGEAGGGRGGETAATAAAAGQVISATTPRPSLAERRKAFFKQYHHHHRQSSTDNFRASGPRDNEGTPNKTRGNCRDADGKTMRSIDDEDDDDVDDHDAATATETMCRVESNGGAMPDAIDNRPRHFFAPLPGKTRQPRDDADDGGGGGGNNNDESRIDDATSTRLSDNSGNSPASEKTSSTVISRARYNCEKGLADICVNGAIPCNGFGLIEKGDAKAFFSSENLLHVADARNNSSSGNSSCNHLTKSVSCQDLSSRMSFSETFKSAANHEQNHAKSDNTLDNTSLCSKPYKSQLNVTLRQPGTRKTPSPDTPEIPKLPSIDYKLFNNPFLQNFEQAYQNFPVRTEGPSPVTHPLSIQVCESPVLSTSYSSPVRVQPSFSGPSDLDCGTCKRKDLDRLRLMMPSSKILDHTAERQEYQVTSFETPSPQTLQIPPMTPYELEALRRMPTGTSPVQTNSRLYQNVPFVPRGAAVYCPGQGMRMYYDTVAMKVPAQTQTSLEDESASVAVAENETKTTTNSTEQDQQGEQSKKRRSRKDKSSSLREKRRSPSSQRHKDQLKKQTSVASKNDVTTDSPSKHIGKTLRRSSDATNRNVDEKNESRSSSSSQESPKKLDQTKRVSLYFSARKRPSITSMRTSRSRSVENARERRLSSRATETSGHDVTNSERERTNSISSSREIRASGDKTRKGSTSSGSVPWCACWGNGCI